MKPLVIEEQAELELVGSIAFYEERHIPPIGRLELFKRLEIVANEIQPLAQDLINRLEGET